MASIYQRGKVWWIKFSQNGKQIRYSLNTHDRATARYKKNLIENSLLQGAVLPARRNTSILQAFDLFIQDRHGRIGKRTAQTDHSRLRRLIEHLGPRRLRDVAQQDLKKYLDRRIREDGISHRTANHTIRVVKTFYNFCVKSDLLDRNPFASMPRYKINEMEQRFLSDSECLALLAAAEGDRAYPVIMCALYTGMRYGEISRLDWADVNLERMQINVRISKSGRFRNIPLHPELKKCIGDHRGTGPVFDMTNFRNLFHRAKTEAGFPELRFHDLRHTFCSMLIKNGVDLVTVSKLAGHSTIKTTMTYAHLYNDHIVKSVNKLKIK